MNIIQWFKNFFNKAIKIAKEFIEQALGEIALITVAELKDFALVVVMKLAETDLTDDEKKAKAFKEITTEAKKRGEHVKDSVVNLLIELAVQYVKKYK